MRHILIIHDLINCNNMPARRIRNNYINKKFGRLTIIRNVVGARLPCGKIQRRVSVFCVCGKTKIIILGSILAGTSKSCGCYQKDLLKLKIGKKSPSFKHGLIHSRMYYIYNSMKRRCSETTDPAYSQYGGRGIKNEWKSFESFYYDMYKSYKNHIKKYGTLNTSIDRVNNNGNYSKQNCRWSTKKQQARNRRSNLLITFSGETKPLIYFTELYGLNYSTVRQRIQKYDWSVGKAFSISTN